MTGPQIVVLFALLVVIGLLVADISTTVALHRRLKRRTAENDEGGRAQLDSPELRPGVRAVGFSAVLCAPYGSSEKKKTAPRQNGSAARVLLTARQMQHINVERRKRLQPMLNRRGFRAAIYYAWGQLVRPPQTLNDWSLFLILYRSLTSDHWQPTESIDDEPISIDLEACYHGQEPFTGDEANHVTDALAGRDQTGAYVLPSQVNLLPD